MSISPSISVHIFHHLYVSVPFLYSIILLPLTPSATKVPNFISNIPSIYAVSQKHNNYHMKIIKNEFLHKTTFPLLVTRHEKKKGNGFSTIPILMSPPVFEAIILPHALTFSSYLYSTSPVGDNRFCNNYDLIILLYISA